MSALSEANAELKARIRELELVNARLERRGRATAHDLSEGLGAIGLFVDALESPDSGLDESAASSLALMRAGIERMEALIRGAMRAGVEATVDVDDVVREALAALEHRLVDTAAEIVIPEPLPLVRADRAALIRLFQNLFSNSLKAQDSPRPLRITVTACREGPRWRFEVADTGCGMDAPLAERAFASAGLPGGGLGLQICREIVLAHGGIARAKSHPGEGMVISFDLAAAEPGDRRESLP